MNESDELNMQEVVDDICVSGKQENLQEKHSHLAHMECPRHELGVQAVERNNFKTFDHRASSVLIL